MPRLSIDDHWTLRPVGPLFYVRGWLHSSFSKYSKCASTNPIESLSIGPRSIGGKLFVDTALGSLRHKCKGPPQETFVGPWGVIPKNFGYELTLISVRHPSTKIHHFLTPKT